MPCLSPSKAILLLLLFFAFNAIEVNAQGCPPNIDFELGNLSGWVCSIGKCCPISTPTISGPIVGRHEITGVVAYDSYGLFPIVAPGSKYSIRLGNSDVHSEAERVLYYMQVPVTNSKFLLMFRYAVVLQDPPHDPDQQPRFDVKAYDVATGDTLPCVNFSFVASSSLPGFLPSVAGQSIYYKPWSAASMDLTAYKGRTIALDFSTGDCKLGSHFGYAYLDIDCGAYNTSNLICTNTPNATLTGPPGYKIYKWMDASFSTTIGTTESITIPTPAKSTDYNIIVSPYPGYGCPDTIPVSLTVANTQLETSNDTTACNGSNIQLYVNAYSNPAKPYVYNWTPATGLNCTSCTNPVANTQNTMTYTVTVTDTNGCSKSKDITITRVKQLSAEISVSSDTICQYAHLTMTNKSINPPTSVSFWNLDTNGHIYSGDGTATAVGWWGTPGIKRIIVHTHNGECNVEDTAYIYVKAGAYAYFDVAADVCLNEPIEIKPAQQNAWYYWSIEGKTEKDTVFKSPIRISYNTLGKKHISLAIKDLNGCVPPPYDTVITVHEFPVTDIYVSEKEICYGDTVTLNTIKQSRYIYAWTPVHRFVTNSESSVRAEIPQPQMVWLEVANEWGCRVYDSFYVQPEHCCNVYFPDAFTPNGDGLNDRFKPISVGHHKIQSFMIANRWGNIIYRSTDQYQGWDGTYKGVKQDYGMYFYYLKYDCTDGEPLEKKGSFLLIR